jgi:hypothetical protein
MWRKPAIGCFVYFVILVVAFFCGGPEEAETTREFTAFEMFVGFTWPIWHLMSYAVGIFNFAVYSSSERHSPDWRGSLANLALVAPGFIFMIYVFFNADNLR